MTRNFIIILSVLVLFSCNHKISERDRQLIDVLKGDIEFKINVCKVNEIIHKMYLEDPSKAVRMMKYYLFQNNLMKYFEMLKMDKLQYTAIDSLNTKIKTWNKFIDTANYFKSHKTELNINPLIHKEISDSIDLFILQNTFLFKMKELQDNAYSGMDIDKLHFNSLEILNIKKQYNLNDSLELFIVPYDNDNLCQFKIKIYNQNKLEYEGLQNKLTLNYKPLKRGKYTMVVDAEYLNEKYSNFNISYGKLTGEFEVK